MEYHSGNERFAINDTHGHTIAEAPIRALDLMGDKFDDHISYFGMTVASPDNLHHTTGSAD